MSTSSRSRPIRSLGRSLRAWVVVSEGHPVTARRRSARQPFRSPVVADVVVTAAVLALSVWNSVKNPYLGPVAPWANLLLAGASAVPLLLRRRVPEVVLAVAFVAEALHISIFALPCAYYAEGAYRGPRSRRTVWAVAGAGLLYVIPWGDADAWSHPRTLLGGFLVNFVLAMLVPLLLGLYVGERRAVLAGLVERAERAEREQRLLAEAARAEERQRIAGEMHDVVSHQVSLIVVHANALATVALDPKVTAEAAAVIQTAGRQALMELREMLGLLRGGPAAEQAKEEKEEKGARGAEEAEGAEVTAAESAAVDRIAALAGSSRAAGLPVSLRTEGDPRPLAEPVERAAYRVVQEALTNVHKHAPGATTDIRVVYEPRALRVSVTNGPAGRPAKGTPDGSGPLLPSGGHGLIGLGERVRLAGGDIETGALADGGFRVLATLPASPRAAG
ncbi:sensor histidine kinase [Streptomyces sp. NPDC053542]|uniref:sensor histidine kinase n=1 Tax=Streptomyces sp. NPDC053542 TaxID=3365710 RepID=UPI0037D02606